MDAIYRRRFFSLRGGAPVISVTGNTDFGSTPVGTPVSKEFTIENTGTRTLEITLPITIVGAEASAFTVTVQPTETSPGFVTLTPGESTTFTVQADADVIDVFSANISIVNNSSENPKLVAIEVNVTDLILNQFFDNLGDAVLLRYKLEEVSGTAIANTGIATGNGTISGTYTLGVDSTTEGAGLGVEADGATTLVTVPYNASFANPSELTILAVARSDNAGEGESGMFIGHINNWNFRQGGIARLYFERNFGTTNAVAISSFNSFIYGNVYTFAAKIGPDKIPRLYINGVETTYMTQTTGVGTAANNATNLNIFSAGGAIAFDGAIFDIAVVDTALSDELILAHYQSTFLSNIIGTEVVSFLGTSITEAQPAGYRPLTQTALQTINNNYIFSYPDSAYPGSNTWVRHWYVENDVIANVPNCIVYEAVSLYDLDLAKQKATEEGMIRRLRTALPDARILVIGMPTYTNNTTPGETNGVQLAYLQSLCNYYGMEYVDWPGRVQALLDASTYTLNQLYTDNVHPSADGHEEISSLLLETLNLAFIQGSDDWTGDLGDYPEQDGGDYYENSATYIARNGTSNDGETGSWSSSGTTRISSEVDATISFTNTFESYGIDLLTDNNFTIQTRVDGGSWSSNRNFASGDRAVNFFGYLTRGSHTIDIKVVSGTVKIKRFLAI